MPDGCFNAAVNKGMERGVAAEGRGGSRRVAEGGRGISPIAMGAS